MDSSVGLDRVGKTRVEKENAENEREREKAERSIDPENRRRDIALTKLVVPGFLRGEGGDSMIDRSINSREIGAGRDEAEESERQRETSVA